MKCDACGGTGEIGFHKEWCWYCKGTGELEQLADPNPMTYVSVAYVDGEYVVTEGTTIINDLN